MKLGDIIIDYRKRMDISQREFSRQCELSNTYIYFLEKGVNPKTGKPMTPTLEQYGKLAHGMGITVQRLFELLDKDAPVDITFPCPEKPADENESRFSPSIVIADSELFDKLFYNMTDEDRATVTDILSKTYDRMKAQGKL